jgi:large subunit ribosomal protein L2
MRTNIKKIKPTTPSQRFRIPANFSKITEKKPKKSLLITLKKISGRNNKGKITVKNRGGGHKRRLRIIDFKRNKENIPAKVKSIEYDPNRTARIALLNYYNGYKAYIISPEGLKVGDIIVSGKNSPINIGNSLPLDNIPIGTIIHNIELKPKKGGSIARSAGCYAQLLARKNKYSTLKLPSGEMRMILSTCMATIGIVSNSENINIIKGKAGRNR